MKLRHAAALALVGWYLMTPPVTTVKGSDRYYRVLARAAICDWESSQRFDSRADCESARLTARQNLSGASEANYDFSDSNGKALQGTLDDAQRAAALFSKCIATDDPRLKPN
jgi:hypothetical protein